MATHPAQKAGLPKAGIFFFFFLAGGGGVGGGWGDGGVVVRFVFVFVFLLRVPRQPHFTTFERVPTLSFVLNACGC